MLRVGALAVIVMLSGTEGFQDAGQADTANLDAGKPKSLPIKYHTVAGLHRIDLIDEDADDETYRAFQLARYTGDANMQVRAHEEEFMRMRREEMQRSQEETQSTELGERRDSNDQNENTAENENTADQPAAQRETKHPGVAESIMGDNTEFLEVAETGVLMGASGDDGKVRIMGRDLIHDLGDSGSHDHEIKDLGESDTAEAKAQATAQAQAHAAAQAQAEALDSVHVANSGDIEDEDQHFVMNDELRHQELKDAVLHKDEQPLEKRTDFRAGQLLKMKERVDKFTGKQNMEQKKRVQDAKDAEMVKETISEKLHKHHLHRDKLGRVVPDFD